MLGDILWPLEQTQTGLRHQGQTRGRIRQKVKTQVRVADGRRFRVRQFFYFAFLLFPFRLRLGGSRPSGAAGSDGCKRRGSVKGPEAARTFSARIINSDAGSGNSNDFSSGHSSFVIRHLFYSDS